VSFVSRIVAPRTLRRTAGAPRPHGSKPIAESGNPSAGVSVVSRIVAARTLRRTAGAPRKLLDVSMLTRLGWQAYFNFTEARSLPHI
jgi:hypothetical protein